MYRSLASYFQEGASPKRHFCSLPWAPSHFSTREEGWLCDWLCLQWIEATITQQTLEGPFSLCCGGRQQSFMNGQLCRPQCSLRRPSLAAKLKSYPPIGCNCNDEANIWIIMFLSYVLALSWLEYHWCYSLSPKLPQITNISPLTHAKANYQQAGAPGKLKAEHEMFISYLLY